MIRLGARLALRGGREALTRLVLTALAIALGTGVLLGVLSEFNAYQRTSDRPCWECTDGTRLADSRVPAATPAASTLWNFRLDFYQGSQIRRLDVAALDTAALDSTALDTAAVGTAQPGPAQSGRPQTTKIPTLAALPGPGEYYASPALAALIDRTPAGELGDRFAGHRAGLLGPDALIGPDELAVVVGGTPADLAALPNTRLVGAVSTAAEPTGTTVIYRFAFAFGTVAVFLPLLILVGTATRLSAARREQRFAAMRLVGATPAQIGVLAVVEAFVAAALGAVCGAAAFSALRSGLTGVTLIGTRYYPETVSPQLFGYLGVLLGVPALAAAAAVWALRRVRIDPLGVVRRQTPKPVRARRAIPLLLGLGVWLATIPFQGADRGGRGPSDQSAQLVYFCAPLVMVGLVVVGPWLTLQASRVLRRQGGAAALLAARRLADDPRAAFRSVSGLTVAVFIGTVVAGLLPTTLHAATNGNRAPLEHVLRVRYDEGPPMDPATGNRILAGLRDLPGVTAIGVRADLSLRIPGAMEPPPGMPQPAVFVASCADLGTLPALGTCAPGRDVTEIDAANLFIDNPLRLRLPVVFPERNAARPGTDLERLPLAQVLVTATTPAGLEQARTYLAGHAAIPSDAVGPDAWATDALAPMTFGEVAGLRAAIYEAVQRMVVFAIVLTAVVAGCSLLVATAGGLVDRRRPFTLLRLSGTSSTSLGKVVFLESVLPLAAAAGVAALTGYAMARAAIEALAPGTGMSFPIATYLAGLGLGALAAAFVVGGSLTLLNRMTRTDDARFE